MKQRLFIFENLMNSSTSQIVSLLTHHLSFKILVSQLWYQRNCELQSGLEILFENN